MTLTSGASLFRTSYEGMQDYRSTRKAVQSPIYREYPEPAKAGIQQHGLT
jgi:hypothetical protein